MAAARRPGTLELAGLGRAGPVRHRRRSRHPLAGCSGGPRCCRSGGTCSRQRGMPKLLAERRAACRHEDRTRRDQAAYTGAVGCEAAARGGAWARRDAVRLPQGAPARERGAAARAARARPKAPERSAAPVPCQRERVARETQPARPHWRGRQAGRSRRCRKGPEMGRPPPRGQRERPPRPARGRAPARGQQPHAAPARARGRTQSNMGRLRRHWRQAEPRSSGRERRPGPRPQARAEPARRHRAAPAQDRPRPNVQGTGPRPRAPGPRVTAPGRRTGTALAQAGCRTPSSTARRRRRARQARRRNPGRTENRCRRPPQWKPGWRRWRWTRRAQGAGGRAGCCRPPWGGTRPSLPEPPGRRSSTVGGDKLTPPAAGG